MDKKPDGTQDPEDGDQADDVEGHSLALVMGLGQAAKNRGKSRAKKPAEDTLTPLTKTFPRMREEERS
jgi:hypothetical protein